MLGNIALDLKDYQLALDYLDRPAARLLDSQGVSVYLRGRALAGLGRLAEAREQLEQAVLVLTTADSWAMLGRIRFELGDVTGAREALAKAVELDPTNLSYQKKLHFLRQ